MFEHLCNDLLYTNQKTNSLTNKIEQLEQQIKTYEEILYVKDIESKDLSVIVNLFHKQKEEAVVLSSKCQNIINKWSNSHHNQNHK